MVKYCLLIAGIAVASGCQKEHESTAAEQAAARAAQHEKLAFEKAKLRDEEAALKAKKKEEIAKANLEGATERADDLAKKAGVEWKAPDATWGRQWIAFANGKDRTQEEGDYAFERGADDSIAVWRKTQQVSGKTFGEVKDDALATDVKVKLNGNDDLKKHNIKVKAEDHAVHLDGTVGDENQAAEAVRIALTTPGAEKVISKLTWAK